MFTGVLKVAAPFPVEIDSALTGRGRGHAGRHSGRSGDVRVVSGTWPALRGHPLPGRKGT